MTKSPSLFALAAAILVSSSPAAAWQPEIVGLDGPAPAIQPTSSVARHAVPAPQPEIVGYADATEVGEPAAEVRLAPLDPVHQAEPADPISFVTPTPVNAGS
jgi:hypothetical protein